MSLFTELKRRNVFRVGIAYLVVAWLVMQIADVILNNIQSPDWVFGTILLLLGIGFPFALVFSWAYELTPDGLKRDSEVDPKHSVLDDTGRRLGRAALRLRHEAAIERLAAQLDKPGGPRRWQLRLSPIWDFMRHSARFTALYGGDPGSPFQP